MQQEFGTAYLAKFLVQNQQPKTLVSVSIKTNEFLSTTEHELRSTLAFRHRIDASWTNHCTAEHLFQPVL